MVGCYSVLAQVNRWPTAPNGDNDKITSHHVQSCVEIEMLCARHRQWLKERVKVMLCTPEVFAGPSSAASYPMSRWPKGLAQGATPHTWPLLHAAR